MLRVLTLSTLFPDASRPQFGIFVENQTLALTRQPDTEIRVVAPIGLPPLGRLPTRYRALARLPGREHRNGLDVYRPRFVHVPFVEGRFDPAMMTRALGPVLDDIRADFAFDVIDAEFFFPDGPAAIALGNRYHVPVSIKARGADIHHWGRGRATGPLVSEAGRAARGLLAVSQALKADMTDIGIPADRVRVHYTGVDREIFWLRDRASAKVALGVEGPLVVTVGALIARKRQRLVIDAIAELPGIRLVVIGDGPERARLETRTERLGILSRVSFMGSLPPTAIADWLAAADVMALPSASEGLANAWVEALASGTPIVITDVGGAREIVDGSEAGRIVAPKPRDIADAIAELLAAPPKRTEVAACAASFDWDRNAAELRRHLQNLVTPTGIEPVFQP